MKLLQNAQTKDDLVRYIFPMSVGSVILIMLFWLIMLTVALKHDKAALKSHETSYFHHTNRVTMVAPTLPKTCYSCHKK